MTLYRVFLCSIILFAIAVFSLLNFKLFWCSLCDETYIPYKENNGNEHLSSTFPDAISNYPYDASIVTNFQEKQSGPARKTRKQFLYITQTESCLPLHFLRPDQLGQRGHTFDILVLSWKHRCKDPNRMHPDVEYIFTEHNTTWSTGRNLLFSHILPRIDKYLYYLFMDDDVMLYHTEPYQVFHRDSSLLNDRLSRDVVDKYLTFRGKRLQRGDNPYREFERFLLEFEPAVGLLNFCFERRQGCISEYVPDVWAAFCSKEGLFPFPFISYSNFDGAFNAFHRDAIPHLLPYHVTYESVNWQESQKYLILKADIKFQGQVLHNLLITAHGTLHRPYPRKIHWHANWQRVLDDLRTSINEKYRNELESLPFEVTKRRFDEIRNPLPPRSPIVPYQHYELNRTRTCHHQPRLYDVINNM